VAALHAVGVEILQTADSHATISCLVRGEDTEKAICALHEAFELGK
jgi:aspartate kinase